MPHREPDKPKKIIPKFTLEDPINSWGQDYHQIFHTNTAVMLVIDPKTGRILEGNAAASRFYGYDSATLQSLCIQDINTLSEGEILQEMELARSKQRNRFEFRHRLASGEIRDVEVYSGPIQSPKGTLLYSIIHDITPLKQTEFAFRKSEEKYRLLVENTSEGIFVVQEGCIVFANRVCSRWAGVEAEQLIGLPYTRFLNEQEEVLKEFIAEYDLVLGGKINTYSKELQIVSIQGKRRWIMLNAVPVIWDEKPAVINFAHGITKRKEAEQALRESEELYRQLFEAESDAVFLVENKNGLLLEANQAASTLYGYTREEFAGMKNLDISAEPEVTRKVTETTPLVIEQVLHIPLRWHRKRTGRYFRLRSPDVFPLEGKERS
ncbi:MAG: PAS domain S-box protein [Anaerolineae bacterium]|nr:PAS domain S-box protein [Anaerolineae bacterium]